MTGPALAFENVRFAYNGVPVLDGINLTVPAGAVAALMGPSGCGKSTAIAIAAGLLQPESGQVRQSCRRPAIMFQDPLLLPWRTALANVAFALKADRLDTGERRQRARAVLATVGLEGDDLSKYPRQLSGGMRQRVALARALVVEPDMLLLDEPFSGLDVDLGRQMLALVRSIVDRRGVSALVVTHDTRQAARFADRVFALSAAPAHVLAERALDSRCATRKEPEIEASSEAILADLRGAP
jgi:NitT/TauT family transport system ATP-binding protein